MSETQAPTHPDMIKVIRKPGSFASYSVSAATLPPGALMARLASPPLTVTKQKRWSSVQISEALHIELNCDWLYVNHGCDPSVEFHVLSDADEPVIEIRVAARRDKDGKTIGITEGEVITFFYPSTEWDMDQPFDCICGTSRCLGRIAGARYLTPEQARGYFLNTHIENLRSVPYSTNKPTSP
ncbi:hypothetical protein PV10_07297 [Exophiala mesophila]|uniref:Post-SET domain-containing protein n=1 Tax=Exophiala mesophila TaxID=212818 RepID=A0A0D1ZT21_EXOME|nr:uncharacterized protein PV10_07297 [Exophiala mesophila]KIV89943.1 hypothetical protein PV10_07297 [Exophiala mesophila]